MSDIVLVFPDEHREHIDVEYPPCDNEVMYIPDKENPRMTRTYRVISIDHIFVRDGLGNLIFDHLEAWLAHV